VVIGFGWLVWSGFLIRAGGFWLSTWLFGSLARLFRVSCPQCSFPVAPFGFSLRQSRFLVWSGLACGKIGLLVRFFVGFPRLAGCLAVFLFGLLRFHPRVVWAKPAQQRVQRTKGIHATPESGSTFGFFPPQKVNPSPPFCR
jgi:hypothetical protein